MNMLINLNETYVLPAKNKAIIAQNGLCIHVFLKGLKIYHNFCVMLRLCAKFWINHFDLQKKRKVLM